MAILLLVWMIIINVASVKPFIQFANINPDSCIQQALQIWTVPASARFSQFASFTLSMPSSRHLYENLFTQSFTPQSFKEYCRNYHVGRREYERCPNSLQKTAALAGYGLADYICIQRLEDFANALPCLQSAIAVSAGACSQQCSQFEQASRMHLQSNMAMDSRMYMAGDCRYLKCLADCRRLQAAPRCGLAIGNVIHEALQNMMTSVLKQQDQTYARVQYDAVGRTMFSAFPEECQAIISGIGNMPGTWYPLSDPQPIPVNPNPYPPSIPPYNPYQRPNPNSYPFGNIGGWSGSTRARVSATLAITVWLYWMMKFLGLYC